MKLHCFSCQFGYENMPVSHILTWIGQWLHFARLLSKTPAFLCQIFLLLLNFFVCNIKQWLVALFKKCHFFSHERINAIINLKFSLPPPPIKMKKTILSFLAEKLLLPQRFKFLLRTYGIKNQRSTQSDLLLNCSNGWLIDFDDMSTHLGLFYAKRLGNHIHIYILHVVSSEFVFSFLYMVLLNTNNF